MKKNADDRKLRQAVESLAATIVEIIESRLRHLAEREKLLQPEHLAKTRSEWEGWVDQKTVVEHLKVSRRTLFNWMQKGEIPHVRLGRGLRFRLSDVDEAMKRRSRGS
jgi:excisionase family DNA binding protein